MSIQIRNFLGRQVNIKEYSKPTKELDLEIDNGKFVKYDWWDISQYKNNEFHKSLNNVAIRKKQEVGRDLDSFEIRIKSDLWKSSYIPPIIDIKTDLPKDGRKRIRVALRNNELFIPVMYRLYSDDTEKTRITSGLVNNLRHDLADEADFDDIVDGIGYLISKEELVKDEQVITEYVHAEKSDNGLALGTKLAPRTINNIITAVMNLDDGGKRLMHNLGRGDALKWVTKCLGFDIDKNNETDLDNEYVLFTPGIVNAYRVLCKHIIPNSITKRYTNIILYTTNEFDPQQATENMQAFKLLLEDNLIGKISHLVNNNVNGVTIDTPLRVTEWKIIGSIPQKVNDMHEAHFDNFKMLSLDEY